MVIAKTPTIIVPVKTLDRLISFFSLKIPLQIGDEADGGETFETLTLLVLLGVDSDEDVVEVVEEEVAVINALDDSILLYVATSAVVLVTLQLLVHKIHKMRRNLRSLLKLKLDPYLFSNAQI